jgi:hypothetical protein
MTLSTTAINAECCYAECIMLNVVVLNLRYAPSCHSTFIFAKLQFLDKREIGK